MPDAVTCSTSIDRGTPEGLRTFRDGSDQAKLLSVGVL